MVTPKPSTDHRAPKTGLSSARDIVTRRIEDQCRRFPQLDLAPLDVSRLDRRDAALAQAIDHAVARRWLTLVALVGSQLSRDWEQIEPRAQAGLLVGAAQLLLFDRLPDHAVIDAAVGWTRRRAGRGAGGLVNAVLRKVSALRAAQDETPAGLARNEMPRGDGRIWRLTEDVFSEDPWTRLAEQTSHPEGLIRRWVQAFGADAAAKLALHDLVQPPVIVAGVEPGPWGDAHDATGFVVYTGSPAELAERLRQDPRARVQDPAAAAAVEGTRHLSPQVILDVCAGRGTKTRQLASVHPEAEIVATDVDDDRRRVLRTVFQGSERVTVIEPSRVRDHAGRAELLLLDVPCSNTGVLARRVEAKYRLDAASLESLANVQRQLIADSIPLLADGGHMLYSTCSLEPEENEHQTLWVHRWHRLRSVESRSTMPHGLPGDPPRRYTDGGFYALLTR